MIRVGMAAAIVVLIAAIGLYYLLEVRLGGKTVLWLFHAFTYEEEGRWHVIPPWSTDEFVRESDAIVIATVVGSEPGGVLINDCDGNAVVVAGDSPIEQRCPHRTPDFREPLSRITLRVDEVLKNDGTLAAGDTIAMAESTGTDLDVLPCRPSRSLATEPGRQYLFALNTMRSQLRVAEGLPSLDYSLAWPGDFDGRLDLSGLLVRTTGCNPQIVDLTYRITPRAFRAEILRTVEGF